MLGRKFFNCTTNFQPVEKDKQGKENVQHYPRFYAAIIHEIYVLDCIEYCRCFVFDQCFDFIFQVKIRKSLLEIMLLGSCWVVVDSAQFTLVQDEETTCRSPLNRLPERKSPIGVW